MERRGHGRDGACGKRPLIAGGQGRAAGEWRGIGETILWCAVAGIIVIICSLVLDLSMSRTPVEPGANAVPPPASSPGAPGLPANQRPPGS